MIINNSLNDVTEVELPKDAVRYTFSASELRSTKMMLNGKVLELGENDEIPEFAGEEQSAGQAQRQSHFLYYKRGRISI